MINYLKKTVIFIILIIITESLYSQDFIIGINFGMGSSGFDDKPVFLKLNSDPAFKLGLSLGYSPYISMLTIISGAEFEKASNQKYINIPLGLKLTIGDKIRFFASGGGYYSKLLKSDIEEDQILMNNNTGMFAGLGLEIELDKNFTAALELQNKFGLKEILKEEDFDYILGDHYDKYKLYHFYICLSLKRHF